MTFWFSSLFVLAIFVYNAFGVPAEVNEMNTLIDRAEEDVRQLKKMAAEAQGKIDDLDQRTKVAAEKKRQMLQKLSGDIKTALDRSDSLGIELGAKLRHAAEEMTRRVDELTSIDKIFTEGFSHTVNKIIGFSEAFKAGCGKMKEKFEEMDREIDKQSDILDENNRLTVQLDGFLGEMADSQQNVTAPLIESIDEGLSKTLETLKEGLPNQLAKIGETLSSVETVLEQSRASVNGFNAKVDNRLKRISSNNRRLMFTATYGGVIRRFKYLLETEDCVDTGNETACKAWANSVIYGDRYGMSMHEVLYNLEMMVMGTSPVLEMQSIMDWYMMAAKEAIENGAGGSNRWHIETVIEKLRTMQREGYDLLKKAYACRERFDKLEEMEDTWNLVDQEQHRFFKKYVDAADPIMRSEISSFHETPSFVADGLEINPCKSADRKKKPMRSRCRLLGCEFCQGCLANVDKLVLAMHCIFQASNDSSTQSPSEVTINPPLPSEKVPASVRDPQTKGITFYAARYSVRDPQKVILCGMKLETRQVSGRKALGLQVDVCDKDGSPLPGSKRSDYLVETDCTGEDKRGGEVQVAERIEFGWNALQTGGQKTFKRPVGKLTMAGLCAEEEKINGLDREVKVLKILFEAEQI